MFLAIFVANGVGGDELNAVIFVSEGNALPRLIFSFLESRRVI